MTYSWSQRWESNPWPADYELVAASISFKRRCLPPDHHSNEREQHAAGVPLDLRQPRQRLDRGADGLKLVMGVNNIHLGRSVPGELLAQLLADTGIRERTVKR